MTNDGIDVANLVVTTLAQTTFGRVVVKAWAELSSGDSGSVLRVLLEAEDGDRTVIVKLARGRTQFREETALRICADLGVRGVPRLLCASEQPPMLLMEDMGEGTSLAQRLLGDNPDAAEAAVLGWATTIAKLQVATLNAGPAFRDSLSALATKQLAQPDLSREWLDSSAKDLRSLLPRLGVEPAEGELGEFRRLGILLTSDESPYALSPADTCPDNNVETESGLALIDFEWAQHRHVAWDAAYLSVPWPTCWCACRLPAELAEAALARWRETLVPALHPSMVVDLDTAVSDATAAWCLISTAWYLPNALGNDPALPDPRRTMPSRRSMIQHRMKLLLSMPTAQPLKDLAERTLSASLRRWGEQNLPLAAPWQ